MSFPKRSLVIDKSLEDSIEPISKFLEWVDPSQDGRYRDIEQCRIPFSNFSYWSLPTQTQFERFLKASDLTEVEKSEFRESSPYQISRLTSINDAEDLDLAAFFVGMWLKYKDTIYSPGLQHLGHSKYGNSSVKKPHRLISCNKDDLIKILSQEGRLTPLLLSTLSMKTHFYNERITVGEAAEIISRQHYIGRELWEDINAANVRLYRRIGNRQFILWVFYYIRNRARQDHNFPPLWIWLIMVRLFRLDFDAIVDVAAHEKNPFRLREWAKVDNDVLEIISG